MVVCFVRNCGHKYPKNECKFFCLPKDNETLKKWKRYLLFSSRDVQRLGQSARVCSCHFPNHDKTKLPVPKTIGFDDSILSNKRRKLPRCAVFSCSADKRKKDSKFYPVPIFHEQDNFKELSKQRQSAWLAALGNTNIDPTLYKNLSVCESHFLSGSCADVDVTNPDWVPTQNMGYDKITEFTAVDSKIGLTEDSQSTLSCSSNGPETAGEGDYDLNKTTPYKAGEIFRNENGQYSFLCVYCDAVSECCQEIVNHIDSHFDINGSINSDNKMTSRSEFISCAVPTEIDMMNGNEIDISNNEPFYDLAASEPEPATGVRFDDNILLTEKESTTPVVLKARSETQTTRPVEKLKIIYSNGGSKTSNTTPTHTLPAVESIKTETTRPVEPKFSVQSEVTHTKGPYKIIDAKIPYTTHTLPVLSKNQTATERLGWRFGEKYQIILDNAPIGTKTHSQDDRKRPIKTSSPLSSQTKIKCIHCEKEPRITNMSQTRPHQCVLCKEIFSNHLEYKFHSIKMHETPTPKAKCYQCESEPPIANQSDPRPHKCHLCKEWVSNHIEFKTHFKEVHDLDVDDVSAQSSCSEFSCYICKKVFTVRAYFNNHLKIHNDDTLRHLCSNCGLRFRTNSNLTQHMQSHENKTYKCDKCDKKFLVHHRLTKHLWCHRTEKDYICNVCSKGFKMRKYLKNHMALHSETKLKCRFCDAQFNFKSCRRVHEKSQHNLIPLKQSVSLT